MGKKCLNKCVQLFKLCIAFQEYSTLAKAQVFVPNVLTMGQETSHCTGILITNITYMLLGHG